jgi:hypothetical protein
MQMQYRVMNVFEGETIAFAADDRKHAFSLMQIERFATGRLWIVQARRDGGEWIDLPC